jgi:hypothetical protein
MYVRRSVATVSLERKEERDKQKLTRALRARDQSLHYSFASRRNPEQQDRPLTLLDETYFMLRINAAF